MCAFRTVTMPTPTVLLHFVRHFLGISFVFYLCAFQMFPSSAVAHALQFYLLVSPHSQQQQHTIDWNPLENAFESHRLYIKL